MALNSNSAGAWPQTSLEELTALPQTFQLDLKGPISKAGDGKGGEGSGGKGRRGWRGGEGEMDDLPQILNWLRA